MKSSKRNPLEMDYTSVVFILCYFFNSWNNLSMDTVDCMQSVMWRWHANTK